jgi:hypothetical protein
MIAVYLGLLSVLLAVVPGCGGSDASPAPAGAGGTGTVPQSGPPECMPLAPVERDVAFGTIAGAGRSTDGTLYVVDSTASGLRLFISEGDRLVRHPVLGSGASGTDTMSSVSLSSTDAQGELHVRIDTDPSGMRMGIVHGHIDGKEFVIGGEGEVLVVEPATSLAGRTGKQTETFRLEHAALVEEDRWLIVISPETDASYEDFRVFFGTADELIEGANLRYGRGLDIHGTDHLQVRFGAVDASAELRNSPSSSPATLELDGKSVPISELRPAAAPQGARFFCSDVCVDGSTRTRPPVGWCGGDACGTMVQRRCIDGTMAAMTMSCSCIESIWLCELAGPPGKCPGE